MLSVLRRAVAVAAVAAFSAGAVEAQFGSLKVEEIRIDVASLNMISGQFTAFGVGAAGATGLGLAPSVALGIYLNDKLALEPTLGISSYTPEGFDAVTTISIGVFAPFYFAGDRGHNGLFVAPGVMISKTSNVDAAIDFGADVGYKKAITDKVSWSAAGMLRSGDSTDPDMSIGARFGFSVFWR